MCNQLFNDQLTDVRLMAHTMAISDEKQLKFSGLAEYSRSRGVDQQLNCARSKVTTHLCKVCMNIDYLHVHSTTEFSGNYRPTCTGVDSYKPHINSGKQLDV